MFAAWAQLHQRAAGVDQRNVGADAGKSHGRAFMDLNAQAVGHKAHYARRFHPWNLLQLLSALRERNEEDIASDVSTHDFHDLRMRDVFGAGDFNLIA